MVIVARADTSKWRHFPLKAFLLQENDKQRWSHFDCLIDTVTSNLNQMSSYIHVYTIGHFPPSHHNNRRIYMQHTLQVFINMNTTFCSCIVQSIMCSNIFCGLLPCCRLMKTILRMGESWLEFLTTTLTSCSFHELDMND